MSAFELLKSLGEIDDKYVAGAAEFRRGRGRPNLKRVWLIAAIVALMLLLVGCVAYSQGWFASFFADRSGVPLSDSQISYIAENEQKINETQSRNGWTVELRSAMKDGNKAYIILGVTGPEGLDLTPEAVDGVYTERFTLSYEDSLGSILSYPKGVMPFSMGSTWEEDGDGLENTANFILEIEPNLSDSTVDPFGGEAEWTIRFDRIVHEYEDTAYKQELLDTKYKDAYGVMFTQEEIQRIDLEEVMAEGDWEFTVTFAEQTAAPTEGELLTAPIQIEADILREYGDEIWESASFREEVTITSVVLQPLSVKVTYEDCNGNPIFWFSDENLFVEEDIFCAAVMQDGSSIVLRDWGSSSGSGYGLLEAETPVIWTEAEYLQFADGTKVYMDGSVEYPERMAQPAAADAYRDIESETGVYAYYGDFDEDGIDDITVWYDGCFRALCLLDEAGETKREFTFENGMYVYETYNQRAEEIKWEPNLIRILETDGNAETEYFYRATVDGLELSVAIKRAAEEYFLMGSDGTFESVTQEEYQAVAEDFQMVYRRMRPIQ